MTAPPADPDQPSDPDTEPADDDIAGPDRDLLGRRVDKWQLRTATTLQPSQEYL